jgi:Ulp1 family protease
MIVVVLLDFKNPILYGFDSCSSKPIKPKRIEKIMRRFLRNKVSKERYDKKLSFNAKECPWISVTTSKQINSVDCGWFCFLFLDIVLKNLPEEKQVSIYVIY